MDKLLKLLKIARPWETNQEIRCVLKVLPSCCNACQIYGKRHFWFRVNLKTDDSLVLVDELYLLTYFLKGTRYFKLWLRKTCLLPATFLDKNCTTYCQIEIELGLVFLITWYLLYHGYAKSIAYG